MELSNSLLKQFASMTQNANKEKETSKNVYGTVKTTGDGKFVTIDGSDILTPVSEGTDVRDGDRVIVSIENHKATVFSNLSSPSSGRTATDLDPLIEGLDIRVNNLFASSITTEYLQANYASITSLAAESARIDKLISTSVTTDYLEANYADIDSLKAVEADITTLKANSITTEYLEANFAKVDLANIEAASIKTYMIGEGVIGSSQIADASITDAKIVEMTASKLSAGTIDAANIEVINLNAANITVGTINGQQIAPGAIDMSNLNADLSGTITETAEDVQQAIADALSAASAAGAAQSTANSALTAANGKNKVFYQTEAPSTSGRVLGDTWFDTDNGNAIYKWDGSKWTSVSLGGFAIQNGAITADQIAKEVNDKLTNAFNNAAAAQTTAGAAQTAATNAQKAADTVKANAVYKTEVFYAQSTSTTKAPTSGWSLIAPPWEDGKYMWQKTVSTLGNGTTKESSPTCIAGANGKDGSQGINIFGFSKGIKIVSIDGGASSGYFDKTINGFVITDIGGGTPSTSAGGGIFRLNNLGLGGSIGWYTISGEIYSTKNVDIGIDLNDFTAGILNVTTTSQKFVLHTNVAKKNGAEFYNGFLDIEGPNTGCPIYVKNFKIEQGKVDNPIWTPALEDLQDSGVYYQNDAPAAAGLRVNDVWFDTNDSNKMYSWSGSSWVQRQFGTNAIANASITNALIADAAINNAKIANLDAGKITTGTLDAARIAANTITADKINVGLGGNLYFNYDTFENITNDNIYHSKGTNVTPTIDTSTAYVGTRCLKIVRNSDTSTYGSYVRLGKPAPNTTGCIQVIPGKKYFVSAYAKASTKVSADMWLMSYNANRDFAKDLIYKTYYIDTSWSRFLFGIYTAASDVQYVGIAVGVHTPNTTIWWDAIQIEEVPTDTSQPTPFKPAGGTIINGANILTSSITASSMVAGTITAASGIIADGAITNAKIQNGAIDNAKIANLDASKITTGTLNADRIGANSIVSGKLDADTRNMLTTDWKKYTTVIDLTPTQYADNTWYPVYGTAMPRNMGSFMLGVYSYLETNSRKPSYSKHSTGGVACELVIIDIGNGYDTFNVNGGTILKDQWKWVTDNKRPAAYVQHTESSRPIFYLRGGSKYTIYSSGNFSPWTICTKETQFGTYPTKVAPSLNNPPNNIDYSSVAKNGAAVANWCMNNNVTYINGGKIYTGTVTANQISAGAINADKLAANAVTAGKIAANAVTTSNLQASAVNADKLAANAVTAGKIAANAVTADNIVAGAITAGKIASKAVDATKMVAGTITAASGIIADAAITTAKIGDLQVTGAKIANLTVESGKIKDGAITTAKIGDAQITNAKIASLDASKITAGTINAARIGSNSITADKINIADLFSKNITATGTITGAILKGVSITSKDTNDFSGGKVEAYMDGGFLGIRRTGTPSYDYLTIGYNGIRKGTNYSGPIYTTSLNVQNIRSAMGTVKIGTGTASAIRVGDVVLLSCFLSGVSISTAYSWVVICEVDANNLNFSPLYDEPITTFHQTGMFADVSGGGPLYTDPVVGGGFICESNRYIRARIQTNKAFSNKWIRMVGVCIINH